MSAKSLEARIQQAGGPTKLLRDTGALSETGAITGAKFSNWRDEQLSWRKTSALFDLSHPMTDINVHGPEAVTLLSDLGVNK